MHSKCPFSLTRFQQKQVLVLLKETHIIGLSFFYLIPTFAKLEAYLALSRENVPSETLSKIHNQHQSFQPAIHMAKVFKIPIINIMSSRHSVPCVLAGRTEVYIPTEENCCNIDSYLNSCILKRTKHIEDISLVNICGHVGKNLFAD